ncbi:MAG: hypothetical protein ACOY90_12995 [Candidatus Zhuqueibacterota bacterium]
MVEVPKATATKSGFSMMRFLSAEFRWAVSPRSESDAVKLVSFPVMQLVYFYMRSDLLLWSNDSIG